MAEEVVTPAEQPHAAQNGAPTQNGAPAGAPAAGAAPSGGSGSVVIRDRFTIFPGKPLEGLNSPNAQAFEAIDKRPGRPVFALVLSPDLPVRLTTVQSMKGQQFNAVLSIIDYGFAFWPPLKRTVIIVIYERPMGGRVINTLTDTLPMMVDNEYQKIIMKPLTQGLSELHARGITHRAIRPNNMFFMDAERTRIVLGECVSVPCGYDQPVVCEPIEMALASPEGRGPGNYSDDMYALGVSLLYILIGRPPAGRHTPDEILRSKINLGSFTALAGDARFPIAMIEVLRGLLADEAMERWNMENLELWIAGRRLSPLLTKPDKRAQRPFHFAGVDIISCRELAYVLSRNWEQAAAPILEGKVEVWLRRSMDDANLAEAVSEQVRMLGSPINPNNPPTPDTVIAKVIMLLDPKGPIRYRSVGFVPEGLGTALAVASMQKKDVRSIAECVNKEVTDYWFMVQGSFDPGFISLQTQLKGVRSSLRQSQPGFGVERCLYELNADLPCLSPLVLHDFVLEIEELLPALDSASKRVDTKSWPADRHIVAFVASRFKFDVDKQINALNSPQADTSALGLLSLLAVLQWKLGPDSVFGLSSWVGGLVAPIINSYHNRDVRKKLEREIPKLVRKGSLPDLYNALDDMEERQKDLDGFAWAKAEYAGAEQEIHDLENDTTVRESQAQKMGQQTAAVVAVMIGLITICSLLAMQAW